LDSLSLSKKVEEAKAAVLEEMTGRLEELGLSITDVLPKRGRKRKNTNTPKQVKYRGQNGETWSGRGNAPLWLRQLELQGHKREEFSVTEG
jgi:DNA-binding protein H-NS